MKKLNATAATKAAALIRAGKVKDSEAWSAPSAEAENDYIHEHGTAAFGKWYLGVDKDEDAQNKGHYSFPYSSNFSEVDTAGLRAIITRAAQSGYDDIERKARRLLDAAHQKLGKKDDSQAANPPKPLMKKSPPAAKAAKAARRWLSVNVGTQCAEVVISGSIGSSWYDGSGASAAEFRDELDKIPRGTPINLRVNSEGGSIQDGLEMYNIIKARSADITCYNTGYCLSIASVFPLAAGRVVSPKASCWMIHSPLTLTIGNADEHAKSIQMLDTNEEALVAIYQERTGKPADAIKADMKAEKWLTGEEAVAYGLADDLGDDEEDGEQTDEPQPAAVCPLCGHAECDDCEAAGEQTTCCQCGIASQSQEWERPEARFKVALAAFNRLKAKSQKAISSGGAAGAAGTAAGKPPQPVVKSNAMSKEIVSPAAAATTASPFETRFNEERKIRITGEVTRRAEGRIKNDALDWWVNLAMDTETQAEEQAVYRQIESFPVAAKAAAAEPQAPEKAGETLPFAGHYRKVIASGRSARGSEIVEVGCAPERPRAQFHRNIMAKAAPRERVALMKRDWDGLLNHAIEQDRKASSKFGIPGLGALPVDANTYSSTLITDYLVDEAVTILNNTLPALSCFSRDFSVDRYKPLATGQIKFIAATASTNTGTKSSQITNYEVGDSTINPISVPMLHYSQAINVSSDDLSSGLRIENLMQIALNTLSNTIIQAALTPLITGAQNSSGSTVAFSAGTYHASASAGTFGWTADMPRLRGYLKKSPVKNAVLDSAFYSFLCNQPGFYQPTMTGARGDRVATFGWDEIQENSLWPTGCQDSAGNAVAGFVCAPQAIGVLAGLPAELPNGVPGNVLVETVIQIPGPDLYLASYTWFSLATRKLWISYDLMLGAAGGDASAGALLFNGAGSRS